MDRKVIETIVRASYANRRASDLAATMAAFHDDATFRLVGTSALHPLTAPVRGHAALKTMLGGLIDAWDWTNFPVVSVLVDGDRAVIHCKGTMVFKPKNIPVESETLDMMRLQDGKIIEFTEFCDTWLVNQITSAAG